MNQRILVVGAGYAGLWSALGAARAIDMSGRANDSIEILLVAPEPTLHARPRLYEVPEDTMKMPLSPIFDAAGVRFLAAKVESIRTDAQEVDVIDATGKQQTLSYDKLVLAAGSKLFRPPVPGLHAHTLSVDQYEDAVDLDAHLHKLASRVSSLARNTVVVVGGGFTGIETAAEMPARLRQILGDDVEPRVVVVERAKDMGPYLGPGPRPVIKQAMDDLGITWRLGVDVVGIDAEGVTTSSGERIQAMTVIWTAGLRATALTQQIPAERDALGRLHVDRNLKVPGLSNVFATGDAARATTDDAGHYSLMSCQHAIGLGRSAGYNVAAELLGLPSIPYSQPHYVTCLALGPWGAVYSEGWSREVKLEGAAAKSLKHTINTEWIRPPIGADRAEILRLADPHQVVVA